MDTQRPQVVFTHEVTHAERALLGLGALAQRHLDKRAARQAQLPQPPTNNRVVTPTPPAPPAPKPQPQRTRTRTLFARRSPQVWTPTR